MLEGSESITKRDCELWGKKVICEFTHVATILWHIKFHLSMPKSPDLAPLTQHHEQYLKYLESVDKKITEMMESAQSIDREEFEKIYDPENFARQILKQ